METSSTRKERGKWVILVGPSGSGKTTMEKHLLRLCPGARHVLTDTTRTPRENEKSGRDYNFISVALFEKRIQEGCYAEYEEVHGRYYGTPKAVIEETCTTAPLAISPIDYKGARNLLKLYPDAIAIFLTAPPEILAERISARGGVSTEELCRRMETAKKELAEAHTFPYLVDTAGSIHYTLERVKYILVQHGVDLDAVCNECH